MGDDAALNVWGAPFLEPDEMNDLQLLLVTVIYAVILYNSSGLISGGSELLMFVPAVADLVGTIVLPILGAVPDGMMTLSSGLGENAQDTVGAGVGVLAGSTVMLLTFPWFLAILSGRVSLDQKGVPMYGQKIKKEEEKTGLFDSGVLLGDGIKKNSMIMILTTLLYLIIQVPAWSEDRKDEPVSTQAAHENFMALIGAIMATLAFLIYLVICFRDSGGQPTDKVLLRMIDGIKDRKVTIRDAMNWFRKEGGESKEAQDTLAKLVEPLFQKFDTNKSSETPSLDRDEFRCMLQELTPDEDLTDGQLTDAFNKANKDGKSDVDINEFTVWLHSWLEDAGKQPATTKQEGTAGDAAVEDASGAEQDDEEEEEEEELPADLAALPEADRMRAIIFRACWMMLLGTFVVLFVSDPFVDCLSRWGVRLGIPSFYVSFVVAPFASNASELLSAYVYAAKKTKESIGTSLSTLIGAACMNNTFCLAIFFALIYAKKLAWQFTAETVAIVLIQWIIGAFAYFQTTQKFVMAWVILACYPLCLLVVYVLESPMIGWD